MASKTLTAEERGRLIDWAFGEMDMPWGPDVIEAAAEALGTTFFSLRSDLDERLRAATDA